MKLVSPPEDWKNALDLEGVSSLDAVKWLAKKHGWIVNEKDGKIYTGPVDKNKPAERTESSEKKIYLDVQWYSQRDTKFASQAGRTCFSSTMAMAAKFLKPGVLSDSKNADDEYLARLRQYGDTTDAGAQLKTLKHLGIKARYRQDLDWDDVDEQLELGKPVGIGWLIWGHVSQPGGGGHWSLVVGKVGDVYIVHDPYGECDLVNGGYVDSHGKAMRYSRENLGRRWMAGPTPGAYRYTPGTGWGILFG